MDIVIFDFHQQLITAIVVAQGKIGCIDSDPTACSQSDVSTGLEIIDVVEINVHSQYAAGLEKLPGAVDVVAIEMGSPASELYGSGDCRSNMSAQ